MKEANEISIISLQEEAKNSEDKEAFTVVTRIKNCRMGVGARLESPENLVFFVEVLVSLCTDHDPVDLDLMDSKLLLLRRLKTKGYTLNCEEDGCVSCELTVQSKNLIAEYKATSSIINKCIEQG
jgi:hypothetical protein